MFHTCSINVPHPFHSQCHTSSTAIPHPLHTSPWTHNPRVIHIPIIQTTGNSRKRGRGKEPIQSYLADHTQTKVNCAAEASVILENALREMGFEDIFIHGMKLLRAGKQRQLFHRDFPPQDSDGCATLVWAWDGPRRITFLQPDYVTSTVTPVVVDLNMGDGLLIPATSMHAGGGVEFTNSCLFFYILKKPERAVRSGWKEKMTAQVHWPLVAEPQHVPLQQDPLHPGGGEQGPGTGGASSSSSAAAVASSPSAVDEQYAAYQAKIIDESNKRPEDCCICMEPLMAERQVTLKACSHKFHARCMDEFIKSVLDGRNGSRSTRCPCCRSAIPAAEMRRIASLKEGASGAAVELL